MPLKGGETIKMKQADIKAVFENHLKVLEDAAKQQCSGVELKALTDAMRTTADTIEYFGFEPRS